MFHVPCLTQGPLGSALLPKSPPRAWDGKGGGGQALTRPGPSLGLDIPHWEQRNVLPGLVQLCLLVGFRSSLTLGAFVLAVSVCGVPVTSLDSSPQPPPNLSLSLGLSPRQPWIPSVLGSPAPLPQLSLVSQCLSVSPTTGPPSFSLHFSFCVSLPLVIFAVVCPRHPTFSGCKQQLLTTGGHLPGSPCRGASVDSHPTSSSPECPCCGSLPVTYSLKT